MKRFIWLTFILLLLATTSRAQLGPAKHLLHVRDLANNPIPDVAVLSGNTVLAKTDQNGYVEVVNPCTPPLMENLNYTLSKPGFRFDSRESLGRVGIINCYGGFQLELLARGTNLPNLAAVSAADYRPGWGPDVIVALFGENLATGTATATSLPLPTTLAGRRVKVVSDFFLQERFERRELFAQLLFVSPTQINCVMPTLLGTPYWLTVVGESGELGAAFYPGNVAGLFAANANGRGPAAAVALRVNAVGAQSYEPVVRYDTDLKRYVSVALDLGAETDRVFLILFGTGLRNWAPVIQPTVTLGGMPVNITFIGAQPGTPGLDQVNLELPRTLAGRGESVIALRFGNYALNEVSVNIK
jgi:uncharacterized protein (TIGR03437 family)